MLLVFLRLVANFIQCGTGGPVFLVSGIGATAPRAGWPPYDKGQWGVWLITAVANILHNICG